MESSWFLEVIGKLETLTLMRLLRAQGTRWHGKKGFRACGKAVRPCAEVG